MWSVPLNWTTISPDLCFISFYAETSPYKIATLVNLFDGGKKLPLAECLDRDKIAFLCLFSYRTFSFYEFFANQKLSFSYEKETNQSRVNKPWSNTKLLESAIVLM